MIAQARVGWDQGRQVGPEPVDLGARAGLTKAGLTKAGLTKAGLARSASCRRRHGCIIGLTGAANRAGGERFRGRRNPDRTADRVDAAAGGPQEGQRL